MVIDLKMWSDVMESDFYNFSEFVQPAAVDQMRQDLQCYVGKIIC